MHGDTTQLRRRHDDLLEEVERVYPDRANAPPTRLLKTVTITTYPTTAQAWYGVVFVTPSGTESEGGALSLTADTHPFLAGNLGASIPASGTYVLGTLVDGRWVFRYG